MNGAPTRMTPEPRSRGDDAPMPFQKYTTQERIVAFWAKVDFSGPVPEHRPELGPCWLWTASLASNGYGRFALTHRKNTRAHRYAYEFCIGPIPDGLQIDHLCRVRPCVNSHHLEPVTHRENCLRGVGVSAVNIRKTHCPQGHSYDEANTYRHQGTRKCLICRRARDKKRRAMPDGKYQYRCPAAMTENVTT